MNLHELKEVFRLRLANPGAKVLLVTKGAAPILKRSRLVNVVSRVPSGNEPLKYTVIVFTQPFDRDEADSTERWLKRTNPRLPVLRLEEPLEEILRLEFERKRPGQFGWLDQFIIENISPVWSSIQEEGKKLVTKSATVFHPVSLSNFAQRIPQLEKAGRIPRRRGKLGFNQLTALILKHVNVDRVVDYQEIVRLTDVVNRLLRSQHRHTSVSSVNVVFRRLMQEGRIPPVSPEKIAQRVTQRTWVPRHINQDRTCDKAEARRLQEKARAEGRDWTTKGLQCIIARLVKEGVIAPRRKA